MKTVYTFDAGSGAYIGPVVLDASDESPLEPGVYLVPAGSVEIEPPAAGAGELARWSGSAWVLEPVPVVPPPVEPPQPTPAEIIEAKKATIRPVREGILNRLAGIALAAQLQNDTDTTAAFLVVRQGLLDVTANLPSNPDEVDRVVLGRYIALRGQCTPTMIAAFAGVDA